MSVEPTPDAAATVPSSPVAPTAAQRRLLPRLVLLLMLELIHGVLWGPFLILMAMCVS